MSILTVDVVAPGWEPVRDEFLTHLSSGLDRGASIAVRHKGELVVDLVGGSRDKEGRVPYDADTLNVIFSTTKGIAALAVAIACVCTRHQ